MTLGGLASVAFTPRLLAGKLSTLSQQMTPALKGFPPEGLEKVLHNLLMGCVCGGGGGGGVRLLVPFKAELGRGPGSACTGPGKALKVLGNEVVPQWPHRSFLTAQGKRGPSRTLPGTERPAPGLVLPTSASA